MAAVQARAFAAAGWSVLQVDLLGCGDSSGEFSEASWTRWVEDIRESAAWLQSETGFRPVLWGLRAGCLLAVEAGSTFETPPQLLLWQPVLSGKDHLNQFLRLKVTGEMLRTSGEKAGAQELKDQLARGELVEIAGYAFSSALAAGLENATLTPFAKGTRVVWLEISGASHGRHSPAHSHGVRRWEDAGHQVSSSVIHGPAFWRTLLITECPSLVDATLDLMRALRP